MTQQATQPPAETLAEAREIAIRFALPGTYDGISTFATQRGDADDKPYMRAILAALTRRAGGDAIGQSDGDPDGWLAVKVNGEGGIVMPYGPLHAGPDRPNDSRYRWAPFYIGDTK